MAATTGPKPIGLRLESCPPLGLRCAHDTRLLHAVENHGNTERAPLPAALLRDVHPPDRTGTERLVDVLHPFAKAILASGVITTSPSTPAVLRPALRSVTRRTLKSVLAREQASTSAGCGPSSGPRRLAVKIRWRKHRSASHRHANQQRPSREPRPLVPSPARRGVQLVLRFWCHSSSSSSQARLTASAPSSPGTMSRNRPVIRDGQRRGQSSCPGFLLPFGGRHSLLGHPIPARGLGLPYGRLTGQRRTTGLPRSPRTSCDRDGCLLYPEDGDAHPATEKSSAGACRFSTASPYPRHHIPSAGASNEASTEVHAIHPSGFPLPVAPGWNGSPWASPPSFAPRRRRAMHVRVGTGHRAQA